MLLNRLFTAILTVVAVVGFAQVARAQYMFLDSNANGVSDTADRLNANGTATTVDLYVRTNQNRDGSTAVCDTGTEPLTINQYQVNMLAVGGVVTYSGFINQQSSMPTSFGELNPDGVRYKNGFGGGTQLAAGLYRLCTLTITGAIGSPRIDIVDLVNGSQDFTDWDGLRAAGGPNNPPVVTNPGNRTVNEQVNLAFTVTATDPDAGQTVTWSLTLGTPAANGATINATTGAFSWTPTEAQGSAVYPVTVTATDNGAPAMSGSAGFTITVNEVNTAPVLAAIGDKTVQVGVPVTFTATATDADIPANTLTFSLDAGAPSGATINASTGAFSWTPTASGAFPVTVRVTDNGSPGLSDFEVVNFMGGCPNNSPPVLAAIGNKTVNELVALTFTATATDPDAGQTLAFSLDAGVPAGAAIGASTGAFIWTPSETQGPGVYPITVRVTDSAGSIECPPGSDFETIQVTVNEVNMAPIVTNPGNRTVAELTNLAFTVTATDADIPANTITWSLTPGTPPGATINSVTGAFSWTPSCTQGPGVYPVTIVATDNGTPVLSGSAAITITVNEVHTAPVVTNPGNRTVAEQSTLTFTATVTNVCPPAPTITWSLAAGAPPGATIGAGTGAFSWTPTEVQGPGTYPVTITATDNGSPPLSGSAAITITVNEVNVAPVLAPIGNKSATIGTVICFAVTATDSDLPANTLTCFLAAGAPPGATIDPTTGQFC